jgi:hypothetical protein
MTSIPSLRRAFPVALTLLVAAAISASTASATPSFSPTTSSFKSSSGASVISGLVKCTSDTASGKSGVSTVVGVLTLEGCEKPCPSTIGLELSGELGEVATSEATTKVGLLMKPNATFECSGKLVKISGSVAGEVTPLNTTGGFVFALNNMSAQKIKTITTSGGTIKPSLLINGTPVTFTSTETNVFSPPVETKL